VIAFEGIESIDAAEALAGLELRVPLDRLTPLPDDVFYRHDLVGCRVEKSDGTFVGTVTDVEAGSGGSRLVVDSAVLVPLAREICPVIDPAGRRIVIEPPEGLLDLNRGS
jgi:16S rRNA processing protein RimM